MKVLVRYKEVYGNVLYYPANREAEVFASIAGKTTLTLSIIGMLESIGISVEILPPLGMEVR